MVQEKYGVRLATQEKGRLRKMIRAGRSSAQAITRARILIKIDEGWTAPQVAAALDMSERTVFRTKRRYAEEGLEEVLRHHNQAHRHRKLDDRVEAHLIALACSPAPEGHDHWTLRLLAGTAVELGLVESLSHETVRLRLKKRPQTLAAAAVVYSQRERQLRGSHGGCPGLVRRTLQSRKAGGLLRRDLHSVAGRRPAAHPSGAGTAQAPGLRVPERGHRQPVPHLRAPPGLAPCGRYPTAHHAGLRPTRCAGWWTRPTPMSR